MSLNTEDINNTITTLITNWNFIYGDYKINYGMDNKGIDIEDKIQKNNIINMLKTKGNLGVFVIITQILKHVNFESTYKNSEFTYIYLNHLFSTITIEENGWGINPETYRRTLVSFIKKNYVTINNNLNNILHLNYFSNYALRLKYSEEKRKNNPNVNLWKKSISLIKIHKSNYDYINNIEINNDRLKKFYTIIIVDINNIILYVHRPIFIENNNTKKIKQAIENIDYSTIFNNNEVILVKGVDEDTTGLIHYDVGKFRFKKKNVFNQNIDLETNNVFSKLNAIASRLLITIDANRYKYINDVHEIRMKKACIIYNINMLNKSPHKVDEKPEHIFWQEDTFTYYDLKNPKYYDNNEPIKEITQEEYEEIFR